MCISSFPYRLDLMVSLDIGNVLDRRAGLAANRQGMYLHLYVSINNRIVDIRVKWNTTVNHVLGIRKLQGRGRVQIYNTLRRLLSHERLIGTCLFCRSEEDV